MGPPLEVAELHRQAVFLRQELDLVEDGGAQVVALHELVGGCSADRIGPGRLDRGATDR